MQIIFIVYDIPDGSATDNGQSTARRRTLSFEEAKKLRSRKSDREGIPYNQMPPHLFSI